MKHQTSILLPLGLCLAAALAPAAATAKPDIEALLAERAEVTPTDLAELGDGFIAGEVDVPDRSRGLALVGIMRLDATAADLHAGWGRVDQALAEADDVSVKALNIISQPAPDDTFASYALTEVEKKALETCKPGKCRVKLPTELIATLGELDYEWERDAEAFTDTYRTQLVAMVRAYQQRGDAGLWVYRDKEEPLHAAEGFKAALGEAAGAMTLIPEVVNYLTSYPEATIDHDVEEFMFWSVLDFGQRPTLTVDHALSFQPANADLDYVMAIKTIYANHYFGGRARFGVLLADGALGVPGRFFVLVDYLQFDGKLNRLMRGYLSRGIVADVENKLRFIRAAATAGGQPATD